MFGGFVDRERELRRLLRLVQGPSSLSLVYGQRRVGKTWLLRRLLASLPGPARGAYFCADETTASAMLRRFADTAVALGVDEGLWRAMDPRDWGAALTLLFAQLDRVAQAEGAKRPFVLVLDEFQYLVAAAPEVPSVLQRLWDALPPNAQVHVLLCGSALGTMAALGDVGQPLHGRFALRVRLRAFGHRQAGLFVPGWSRPQRLRAYGVFGGLARHLAVLRPDRSLRDNAVEAILDPMGVLHEAPLDILRGEHLSAIAPAAAVLGAVAAGENRFGAIAARTGLTAPRTDGVLKELMALDVVRREVRFGDKPGARYARYRCVDPFTGFWFRFVQPNRSALNSAPAEEVWDQRVAPHFAAHMGVVFEDLVARAFTEGLFSDQVGAVDAVAPWWSRDGQTELDLVVRAGGDTIFVECKWRPEDGQLAVGAGQRDGRAAHRVDGRGGEAGGREGRGTPRGRTVGVRDLERLKAHVTRSGLATSGRVGTGRVRYALVTAGAFSPALRSVAEESEDLLLLGPDALWAEPA